MCTCKSKPWWFNSVAVSFLVFLFKSCCFYFWQWNHVLHADALGVLVWLSVCVSVCARVRACVNFSISQLIETTKHAWFTDISLIPKSGHNSIHPHPSPKTIKESNSMSCRCTFRIIFKHWSNHSRGFWRVRKVLTQEQKKMNQEFEHGSQINGANSKKSSKNTCFERSIMAICFQPPPGLD